MVEKALRRLPAVPATEWHAQWLKALPPATRMAFNGGAAARAAALPIWGVPCSEEPLRANLRDARASLWLGPDEYLLLEFGAAAPLIEPLEQALGNIPHAVVDISHRQFAVEVSGPHASTIVSGACPLDLDLGEFPLGMCTRTVLAKADIVLWRTREDAFHVEVWRSFAGYVTGLLTEIAGEFYPARPAA